ncbi:MAG: hypothetical protein ABSC95_19960 [Acetobacteraceae bacterium]|jgi:hypothetical protein
MSDTVSGAVIVSSLGSGGPTFLFLPDSMDTATFSAVHVHGSAYTGPTSFGLAVDFSTLSPDLQVVTARPEPIEPAASVSGYTIVLAPDEIPPGIPGALHQS